MPSLHFIHYIITYCEISELYNIDELTLFFASVIIYLASNDSSM